MTYKQKNKRRREHAVKDKTYRGQKKFENH